MILWVTASLLFIQTTRSFSFGVVTSPRQLNHLMRRRLPPLFSTPAPEDSERGDLEDAEVERRIRLRKRAALSDDRGGSSGWRSDLIVPGFVGVWAVGYSLLAYFETQGPGLGDLGGKLGVAFACILLLTLVAAALFEVLKPESPDMR